MPARLLLFQCWPNSVPLASIKLRVRFLESDCHDPESTAPESLEVLGEPIFSCVDISFRRMGYCGLRWGGQWPHP